MGTVCFAYAHNSLFHVTDWLPTLYSAAGGDAADLPSSLDGVDQWEVVTRMRGGPSSSSSSSSSSSVRTEVLYNMEPGGRGAVR